MRGIARTLATVVCVIVFIVLLGASYAFSGDKVFSGRVVDAKRKEPIEGAVVVIYWYEATTTTIGNESTRIKDVQECLTDKQGEWAIIGEAGENFNPDPYHFLTGTYYTRKPEFIIFKPGYCSWPEGYSVEACQGKMKFTADGEAMEGKTLELPKLWKKEDRLRIVPDIVGESFALFKKQKAFMRLINEERRDLDLGIIKMYEELVNEK